MLLFFPWMSCSIESPLPPESCSHLLASVTQEVLPFTLLASRRPSDASILFRGQLKSGTFNISRIIDYRNSFLPDIKGTFHPQNDGTRITLSMRLNPFVAVFMAVWLGAVGSVALGTWVSNPIDKSRGFDSHERLSLLEHPCLVPSIGLLTVKPVSYRSRGDHFC